MKRRNILKTMEMKRTRVKPLKLSDQYTVQQ